MTNNATKLMNVDVIPTNLCKRLRMLCRRPYYTHIKQAATKFIVVTLSKINN